jgi:hypothetical protein
MTATLLTTRVPRTALLTLGVLAAVAAAAVAGPWVLALWLLPDVALLGGLRDGRLAPRAVPVYNALHALPAPAALTAAGAVTGGLPLALGLLWLSHVGIDRGLGYGLRAPDGTVRA